MTSPGYCSQCGKHHFSSTCPNTPRKKPLSDWTVCITMSRRMGNGHTEIRTFKFVIPAVGPEEAKKGAVDMGLGINTASDHQWKFADEEEHPITVF